MDRIFSASQRPFDDITSVGVGIGTPESVDQRHIGILHRDEEHGSIVMLHLAWHHTLRREAVDDRYLWADPDIHPRRLIQVAALCRKIYKMHQRDGIPYAFSPPNDCFDSETGKFLFGDTQLGLTCASFVLALFHSAGLCLIKYETWPSSRSGDVDWQNQMIALLERTHAGCDHIEKVRKQIGNVRYRPEEVAVATTLAPLPAEFKDTERFATLLLDRLRGHADNSGHAVPASE